MYDFDRRTSAPTAQSGRKAQRAPLLWPLLWPLLPLLMLATLAAPLQGCGGGRDAAPDVQATDAPLSQPTGADAFLLFVNPQNQGALGSPAVDSLLYAQAYYLAIDPNRARDTLQKWKTANRFDQPFGPGEGQETVVFGDQRDLGYGRRMTARFNGQQHVAVLVENYQANPGASYGYTPLNVQAAVAGNERWRVAYNAIEYSVTPGGTVPFAKFFSFDAKTGAQLLQQDLDGRGNKALPGACLNCHGGRADALVRSTNAGAFQMRVAGDAASRAHGDVQGKLHALEVESFDFAQLAGFTRAEQEAKLKRINQWVLCTYPLPAVHRAAGLPEDSCRRTAETYEWQGGADAVVKRAYGGAGLPAARYSEAPAPTDWVSGGHASLYTEVVAPSCRGCHLLRGSGNQSEVDFSTLSSFKSYAQRIGDHVFNRGDMPASKLVYDNFVKAPTARQVLAQALESWGVRATDAAGRVLEPGRPLADPGPDRVVLVGYTVQLSAKASRFASRYAWRLLSSPGPGPGAVLTLAQTRDSEFKATAAGLHVLELQVFGPDGRSDVRQLTVVARNKLSDTDPAIEPKFGTVVGLFKPTVEGGLCATGCHLVNPALSPALSVDNLSDQPLYDELRSRINFETPALSPLLTKPAGQHHAGLSPFVGPPSPSPAGSALNWQEFLQHWVLMGAPR